jgi:hypothetical protein
MVLENYETVAERIEKFWIKYPSGRIHTQLIHQDGTRYIAQCDLYKDVTDPFPFATDYAEEIRTNNNRFPAENAITSAIGRALHTGGISKFSEGIARPSAEEMSRVSWTAPIDEPTLIAQTMGGVIEQVATGTAPNEAPQCSHGHMLAKMGISPKTNKPYSGWVCSSTNRDSQCKPIWN